MARQPHLRIPALFVFLAAAACAGTQNKDIITIEDDGKDPFYQEIDDQGLTKAVVDTDGNGEADMWTWYDGTDPATRKAVRRQVDLNKDGQVDITTDYGPDGKIAKEYVDADFDTRIDWVDSFEDEERVKTEVDSNYDGRIDRWKFFAEGMLIRLEEDTDGDGRADYWEYYSGGSLKKSGRDTDGDGKVDQWGSGEAYLRYPKGNVPAPDMPALNPTAVSNPCAPATNPCANPCSAAPNPCAPEANPCANPCAPEANPCANPCAAKANPCGSTGNP